ncbi:acetylserotonin O-methyltransferase [Pseudonocardia sp. RS11V-5]|uniref:acetylserotonin O-methyltransferase n=1 Tax=Pseudonocardia terrae TaxID=2905831 RepID=UPI001E57A1FB|nr:acetylserotonin O-methyltransferase [Pseudonocardia terrae]MCE3553427.1 acetylserotonin O-methyltransferase [Pseudonocardia terrae]
MVAPTTPGTTPTTTNDAPAVDAVARLGRLADGYLVTAALHVAAELGVADVLARGACDAEGLAAEVGARPGPLRRVLRLLVAEGVLVEFPDGTFSLTPSGRLLRSDVPGSLRGSIRARGGVYATAAPVLADAVREGGVAFERARGEPFFEHLARNPAELAAFQASMVDRSAREAANVLAVYDFGRFRRLVDVGGGTGILLSAILTATPGLSGVLVDRAEVVASARVPEGTEVVAGDFFAGVPAGGDAYLLSWILHDWDDADARRILTRCREAMAPDGTLLVVDAVLPERAVDGPAVIRLDVTMLLLATGCERTGLAFGELFASAGFTLRRIMPMASPMGLAVLEAVPA